MGQKSVVTPTDFPWMDLSRYTFSPGIEKAGLLFLSGQAASEFDPASGTMVCRGDVAEQCRTAFEKLGRVLQAAGMGFEHVVKTTDYISPRALEGYRATAEVRRKYFKGNWSAATGIVVESLLRPDALIEIDAIAVREPRKQAINLPDPRWERLTYFPAVRTGNYLWLSGFTGRRYDPAQGTESYPPDVVAQTQEALHRLGQVLTAAGASARDVLKTMDYISPAGLTNYRATRQPREDFFQGSYPAATGIVMNRLLHSEAFVETDMVAVLGGERQEITPPGWEVRYNRLTFRAGVKKGNLLFIAGQGALDPHTNAIVGEGDIVAQARTCYERVAAVLHAAGGSLEDVVKTTEFITPQGLAGYRDTAGLRRELFKNGFPAATGVVVNQLLRPGMLIEVDAVAVVD